MPLAERAQRGHVFAHVHRQREIVNVATAETAAAMHSGGTAGGRGLLADEPGGGVGHGVTIPTNSLTAIRKATRTQLAAEESPSPSA